MTAPIVPNGPSIDRARLALREEGAVPRRICTGAHTDEDLVPGLDVLVLKRPPREFAKQCLPQHLTIMFSLSSLHIARAV